MRRTTRPPSPLRDLIRMLWQQPLWAIPFGLFFGTVLYKGPRGYLTTYKISVVFAYTIGLAVWAVRVFVLAPRRPPGQAPVAGRSDVPTHPRGFGREAGKIPLWAEILTYVFTAIAASFVAALVVHLTFQPGLLGSPQQVATVGAFALVFSLLVTGGIYAYVFYHGAIDRARSEQELHMARRIQRSFLLTQFPSMPRLEVHAANISSKQVSGDFYDVVPAGDGAFLLAIADVAGKGVPAALLSSMLQASLRTQANTVRSVAEVLRNLNTLVYRSTAVHQFATFFLARVEEPTLRLAYANAGHNHPLVFRRGGECLRLDRGGTVVGILEGADFEEQVVQLEPGDRLVLYTDGISEAERAGGELFGEERLVNLVATLPPNLAASETTERILDGVRAFLGEREPGDDMTLLVLRVLTSPTGVPGAPSGGASPLRV